MEKISCNIIKDLLPLYVDGILSEETTKMVEYHLETCKDCQKEYEVMRRELILPSAPSVQEESGKALKGLKRRIKINRIITAAIAAIITAVIITSACMVYIHVGVVHDQFAQDSIVTLRDIQTNGEWEQLEIGDDGYLNFNRLFSKKQLTVDANSDGAVTFRIIETDGDIVVDTLTVQPGESAPLKALKLKTNYKVDIQADADFILIRFN